MLTGLYVRIQNRVDELRNDRGASAVEYGLIVALIAVVIIIAVTALGVNLRDMFQSIADTIANETP